MFSFHKPRVYRSTEGCCICRAKSSSSRFTDSRKYESDLMKCFDLEYQRSGEICNACVLLVKRYKRLPLASSRHWGHVVDARAGPGTKSLTKYKKYKDDTVEPGTSGTGSSASARQSQNGKSLIPEKFSKIFKKTKKSQSPTTTTSTPKVKKEKLSRSSTSLASTWETSNHSLPTTPDSLDSDYEDNRISSPALAAGGTVVQFQTQTRASSYRSRNNAIITTTVGVSASVVNRKSFQKLGSKRRKIAIPRKNRRAAVDNAAFFDENEWQERKSCCGMVHECASLSGALIIDLEHYKPCVEHQQRHKQQASLQQLQKTIIATMPAVQVVQLAPPSAPPVLNTNSTQVLKKHHLFFKRQSECFPQGDANFINNGSNPTTSATILNQNLSPPVEPYSTTNISASSTSFAASSSSYMPRHSTAKITTILPSSAPTTYNKAHNFLHKIKSDTGKIVKHSLDKINTAVRIKPSELQEMKQVIKTVDKSFVLAKPPMAVVTGHQQQQLHHTSYQHVVGATTVGSSPNSISSLSSSSSSSAPKFSDNSSDSGFDENMLDRKSASPLQEDTDRKLLSRPGVHTMILASGVQIQGQQQNLVLTGNEVAAKILQNRRQHAANMMQQQHLNNRSMASAAATAVKITPIGAGSHNKMRAIYNNNTIQHENGVTTIVPASSFAATSQTAAMNALAPSTVTITPAAAHKKLSIGSSNMHSPSNIGNNHNIGAHFNHNNNVSSLNQKIILVKTATKYNSSNNGGLVGNSAAVASSSLMPPQNQSATAKHGHHHTQGKN